MDKKGETLLRRCFVKFNVRVCMFWNKSSLLQLVIDFGKCIFNSFIIYEIAREGINAYFLVPSFPPPLSRSIQCKEC